MSFDRLCADHREIDHTADLLLTVVAAAQPNAATAAALLDRLAVIVREHVAAEDPVLYATVAAAEDGPHAGAAERSASVLEALKADWTTYLCRWDAAAIAADWRGFTVETVDMIGRLRERVVWETSVLYGMAVHHGVIAAR